MQKFNEKLIEEIVSNLEKLTNSISDLLSSDDNFSFKRDRLNELLDERSKLINLFAQFPSEENIKKLISENFNNWAIRIQNIITKDKANLEMIESSLINLGEEIKNFNRQKSLLIYSKGQ